MDMNDVNWIEIAVRTASARVADKEQYAAVCRYLRGEVERLERELYRAYKRQGMSNNPFPPILAEEVQRRIDDFRGELNYPGEVTDE